MKSLASLPRQPVAESGRASFSLPDLKFAALALTITIFAFVNPYFRSVGNIDTFLQSIGVLLILAMGQSFVLLIAGIDLSVGALVALGSVIVAAMLEAGWPLSVSIAVTLAATLTFGALSGALTLLLRIPSFIVTFAMMGVAYSSGLMLSGANRIPLTQGSGLPALATGEFLRVPYQIWLAMLLLITGTLFLRHIPIGRHLYAVGGNAEASRLTGVSIRVVTLAAFGLSGLFAGIAAVVYASRIISGNPIGGSNLNLEAIAAAVIGGVSLFGGRGTLFSACFGAILYSLIKNILNIYNVNPNITEIAAGCIIILAGVMNVMAEGRQVRS